MQVLSRLAPVALLAAGATAQTNSVGSPGDFNACWRVNNNINWAISKFCNHQHLYSPGPMTQAGQTYGSAHIKILGNCHPIKHVGPQMCKNRFLNLCATQGSMLPQAIRVDYGNGCTKYIIEGSGKPHKSVPAKITAPAWLKNSRKGHGVKHSGKHKHRKHKYKKGKKGHGKKKHHKKKKNEKRDEEQIVELAGNEVDIYELLKDDLMGDGPQVEPVDNDYDEH